MSPITRLPSIPIEGHAASTDAHDDHPMRVMTRRAAGLAIQPWDAEAAGTVAGLFDALASEWHRRESPERAAVITDALERGLDPLRGGTTDGTAVEIGSGLGTYSSMIDERFANTMAVELAEEMHRRARRTPAHRVLADASSLPVADTSVESIVMINAFLFPGEVGRVLRPGGTLLWVNSSGERTPIHLRTSDVVAALPFPVSGVESRAGAATWCALRRAD